MGKVLLYSMLLVAGLVGSQVLPHLYGVESYRDGWISPSTLVRLLTMIGLCFIMIHVGYEFDIDKKNPKKYGWDYFVAATAAAFPWIFCCLYFVFVMIPSDGWHIWGVWKESLLASRFSAPTSAGVLFSMLAAAGLGATWVFKKARILAIFDDLDTVLLMIPLKMAMVGLAWQLGVIVIFMAIMLWMAWRYLHAWKISIRWPAVVMYSVVMVGVTEVIYQGSKLIDDKVPIHFEVLLPAFVLGCMIARQRSKPGEVQASHEVAALETSHHHDDVLETPSEKRMTTIVSACFMLLVGLSMPLFINAPKMAETGALIANKLAKLTPEMGWGEIAVHVAIVTVISNLGKMFPALCYRKEASWRQRLAVAIGMWPRGEVGAGVLVLSISYGIGGPIVVVAMLSLAVNLLLTGVFIAIIKKILASDPEMRSQMATK
jgi:Kef-type K+ transport system membrane component KefB